MHIRGYYPKTGKSRRYAITSDGYNRIGSVSISSESGNYKYHVWWEDGKGHSLEGTVYRGEKGYTFRPLYVNGRFMGDVVKGRRVNRQPFLESITFRSRGQWPLIIDAIEFAKKYPIKDEKEDRKWGSWLVGGVVGFIASLFVGKRIIDKE